ncbi:MAG TPA: HAMP domain-containing sensor histidine kinase [Cyclobacteriaceae bacterium]|nr:HAMP domain-containing sensor histidine kinase [Cyclobacteriaceae bacterium]
MSQLKFRNFFISKNVYFESWIEYKRTILTGYILIISWLIGLFYTIVNLTKGLDNNLSIYLSLIVGSTIIFLINRNGKQLIAGFTILIMAGILVFYFSSIENIHTGVYFYYITNCIGAFVILGFENKKLAIIYFIISIIAFYLSYIDIFSLYDPSLADAEFTRINLLANFFSAIFASVLIIYFLLQVNYESEKILKQNESVLYEKNNLLIKANEELDRFVYITSHDLKAPLSSIMGIINLLEKNPSREEINNLLSMMKDRVQTMENFIKDITDYARNARSEISITKVNLKSFIDRLTDEHQYSYAPESLKISVEIPSHLELTTDLTRLRIILNNLINNAIKYADKQKESFVKIKALEEGDYIVITIHDNGHGIKDEHLNKIFNMFYRASEKSKGSGIGLYIVKESLEKVGGKIAVESTYGKGSTFTMHIPHIKD